MIDNVKDAVKAAITFVQEVYDGNTLLRLRLEEIDQDGAGNWLVTVGWIDSDTKESTSILAGLNSEPSRRVYKVVEVDGKTGEVRSMKIREPVA